MKSIMDDVLIVGRSLQTFSFGGRGFNQWECWVLLAALSIFLSKGLQFLLITYASGDSRPPSQKGLVCLKVAVDVANRKLNSFLTCWFLLPWLCVILWQSVPQSLYPNKCYSAMQAARILEQACVLLREAPQVTWHITYMVTWNGVHALPSILRWHMHILVFKDHSLNKRDLSWY